MRILWYPKRWKKILGDRTLMYATSNRVRVYNNHEVIRQLPGVVSDVAGFTVSSPKPTDYDAVILQKSLDRTLALLLRASGVVTLWDVCDTLKIPRGLSYCLDGMIVPNHRQAAAILAQNSDVPVRVVEDAYEADTQKMKQHQPNPKIKVTCFGTFASIDAGLRPLRPVLDKLDWIQLEYADGRNASNSTDPHPGHRTDIAFHMDWREAAKRADSWQAFIFSSDVGLVPISDEMKSSNRIINYMAYGIPVICSPIDSYKRVIRDGENGFLAQSKQEWVRALEILRDPETRRRIGQKARETVLERYNIETIGRQYYAAISDLAQQRKSKPNRMLRPITRLAAERIAAREASSAL